MAYLTVSEFRADTASEYCADITLEDSIEDALVTAAIVRMSQRFDDATHDHYASESLTLTMSVPTQTDRLVLPKRCTAVTSVSTIDYAGASTAQASTLWRLNSSLESSGSRRKFDQELDTIDIIPGAGGLSGYGYTWPVGYQTVQVAGTYGWTTTPGDVKRAVALLVWDSLKPIDATLRRAESVDLVDRRINLSGIPPEAAAIIEDYMRPSGPWVG